VDNDYPIFITANNLVALLEKNDNLIIFIDNELMQGTLGDKQTIKELSEEQDIEIQQRVINYVQTQISQKNNQNIKIKITKIPS
jgi:hypothetical protein